MKTHGLKMTDGDIHARRFLDCGGKRSATPLSNAGWFAKNLTPCSTRKVRRRFALPEQSKTWRQSLTLVSCLLILHSSFFLQAFGQYTLRRSSISTIGGTSTGGSYSLRSAIGTTTAGSASGGNFSVKSSPWSLFVVETPGAPALRIFMSNSITAVVAWPAPSTGWTLQQNTNPAVAAGWVNAAETINVVGGENQIIVSPPSGNRFYRLIKP